MINYCLLNQDHMAEEARGFARVAHKANWQSAEAANSELIVCLGQPAKDALRLLQDASRHGGKLLLVEHAEHVSLRASEMEQLEALYGRERFRKVDYDPAAGRFLETIATGVRHLLRAPAEPARAAHFDWKLPPGECRGEPAPEVHGREWLKSQLLEWAGGREGKPMLLLGSPGNGKTTMLQWLREHWMQAGRPVVSHFCCHDREDTLRPGQIVQSLAVQMKDAVPGYQQAFERSPEARRAFEHAEADPVTAWVRCVLEPLQQASAQGCLLVLDALDESRELAGGPGGEHAKTLLTLISARSFKLPPGLRVLVSSRPIDGVLRLQADFQRLDVDSEENRADIGSYAGTRIDGEPAILAYLAGQGRAKAELVARLAQQGNFLLAKNLLESLSASSAFRRIPFDALPLAFDQYYHDSFERRVWPRLSPEQRGMAKDFLGSVVVVREPLPADVHAQILARAPEEILAIYTALSGLLVHPPQRPHAIASYHPTLEDWLRGRPGSTPGAFGVAAEAAERRLLAWCAKLVDEDWLGLAPNSQTDTAAYLAQYGIELLVAGEQYGRALKLLAALARLPQPPRNWDLQCDRLMRQLEQRWAEFDEQKDRSQALKEQRFREIDFDAVAGLLDGMDYETGKYVALFRTAVEFHPRWKELLQALLAPGDAGDENDIVFRNDVGVAYAQAWLSAHAAGTMQEQAAAFWGAIEAMAAAADDGAREIAGYALKHLCQRGRELSSKRADICRCWVRYAASEHPTDRMVAGEMAVALAVHGTDVRDWLQAAAVEAPQRFWQPVWPNHCADLYAWTLLLDGSRRDEADPWAVSALDARLAGDFEWRSAQVQFQRAAELRRALRNGNLLSAPGLGLKLPLSAAEQQAAGTKLRSEEALDGLWQAWQDPALRPELLAFFQLLLLHPLWNITELGASLLSDLWKRHEAGEQLLGALEAVASESPLLWRLRYGLVDAAYNAGGTHGYARFLRLVLAWGGRSAGGPASCRVQGICADDLVGWLEEATVVEVRRQLRSAGMRELLAGWLEDARDIWLLEYLHGLFNEARRKLDFDSVFDLVDGRRLSPYLAGAVFGQSQDGFFHEVDERAFLLAVDALRRRKAGTAA